MILVMVAWNDEEITTVILDDGDNGEGADEDGDNSNGYDDDDEDDDTDDTDTMAPPFSKRAHDPSENV